MLTIAVVSILIVTVFADAIPFALNTVFGDNMVLQRSPEKACIWGTAPLSSYIYAELESKNYKARPDGSGNWKICLDPHAPSDRAYNIAFTCSGATEKIDLKNVLFGDVYICSGQSNMEFTVKDSFTAEEAFTGAADNRLIRVMTVERNSVLTPQADISKSIRQKWSENSAATLGKGKDSYTYFSATCYYFGLTIFQATQIPIGLIASSWGGTTVEAWSPKPALDACIDRFNNTVEKNRPSSLYNGMIYAFLPMTIKGAIFYQGEDNVGVEGDYKQNKGYACSFPKMISEWRKAFSSSGQTNPNFPFGFVQLAGYCKTGNHLCTSSFKLPELRFAQAAELYEVPNQRLPNTFMATAIDLQDPLTTSTPFGNIHPRTKKELGQRLGNAALKFIYGHNRPWTGPVLKGCSIDSENKNLTISVIEEYLGGDSVVSKTPEGFEILDDKSAWTKVNVIDIKEKAIIVSIPANIKVTGIRYLWEKNPCCPGAYGTVTPFTCEIKRCNIYAKNSDLPMAPFRVNIVDNKCVLEK